jgi:hypothetical protein
VERSREVERLSRETERRSRARELRDELLFAEMLLEAGETRDLEENIQTQEYRLFQEFLRM